MNNELLLINGLIIAEQNITKGKVVLCRNGKIAAIGNRDDFGSRPVQVIDLQGCYLSPGFIDIHVHGGGGADLMDGDIKNLQTMARTHALFGTTTLVPTTISAPWDKIRRVLALPLDYRQGPEILGFHLEGPWLNPAYRGAHSLHDLAVPDLKDFAKIEDFADKIILITLAPELKDADKIVNKLKQYNILPAIGHSAALYPDVCRAVSMGCRHVTHLYNAMSGVTKVNGLRRGGLVESALLLDELTVEVIADGKHIPPELLMLIYKLKGPAKMILVTDAIAPAGIFLGSEEQKAGNYMIKSGVAWMEDGVIAGSLACGITLIKNMVQLAKTSLPEAVRMFTATPAKIIGVGHRKGHLIQGYDADLVAFDQNYHVRLTVCRGEIFYIGL